MTVVRERDPELDLEAGARIRASRAGSSPRLEIARQVHLLPIAAVVIAVIFNLVVLRTETIPAHNLNDGAFHISMIRWAQHQIEAGRSPLDGWYPYLGLGYPQFHHYQTLPHVITGYLATLLGSEVAYVWTLYLLLAFWPVSIYWAARLFGRERWEAAAAAVVCSLVSSFPGYGYEFGSYLWRGLGVWPQLWGMWLLPLALGFSYRAVARGTGYAVAALFIALTFAMNFMTGYLALVCIGLWILIRPSAFRRRFGRGLLVAGGSLLTAAFVIVPLVVDRKWANQSEFLEGFWRDSFGAAKVAAWFVTGRLFDNGRLPVITILVAVGLAMCIARFRRDEGARAFLGLFALSTILFFGRATFGPLMNLLPGGDDLHLHRFIIGVHLAGIFAAGVAAVRLVEMIFVTEERFFPRSSAAGGVVGVSALCLAFLAPAWIDRAAYATEGGKLIETQRAADLAEGLQLQSLIDRAKSLGVGRVYSGNRANWGKDFKVGYVPVHTELVNHDADSFGMTMRTISSLSNDIEIRFDETNPYHYHLFNVRYLILPSGRRPGVGATQLEQRGGKILWRVETTGYLDLVDTIEPIVADRTNLGRHMVGFLASSGPAKKLHPSVQFDDQPAAPPTAIGTSHLVPGGEVIGENSVPAAGVFSGSVRTDRPAVLLLKSTFHPRWQVRVDGVEVAPQMIAPSFVGRTVPAGVHQVTFEYVPYDYYGILIGIGALTLAALQWGPALSTRLAQNRQTRRWLSTMALIGSSTWWAVGATTIGLALAYLYKVPCATHRWDGFEFKRLCYNDIFALYFVRGLAEGKFPYVQADLEYPAGTGLFIGAIGRFVEGGKAFFDANAAALSVLAIITTLGLLAMAAKRTRVLLWALAPTMVLYAFHNWDVLAVAFMVAGLLAFQRGRDRTAGAMLGVGAAIKLFPSFILPAILVARWRERGKLSFGMIGGAAAAFAAVNVPLFLLRPAGWFYPWHFQSTRFPNIENVWYFIYRHASGLAPSEFWSKSYPRITGVLSTVIFVIAVAWLIRSELKRERIRPYAVSFGILCLFLLTSKVYSPQYSLWLLPFLVLLQLRWRELIAFFATDAAVWISVSAYFLASRYGAGSEDFRLNLLEVLVFVRYGVIAWLLARSRDVPELVIEARPAARTVAESPRELLPVG